MIPVPIDLNLETFGPISLEEFRQTISPKTKAVVFAYIFGIMYDIEDYIDICEEKGIDIIEDSAENFNGLRGFRGNKRATMTMFSFGLIKTCTTINGGVSIIRSKGNELFKKMRDL